MINFFMVIINTLKFDELKTDLNELAIIYDENRPKTLLRAKKAPPEATLTIIPQRKALLTERLTGRHNMGHQRVRIAEFVVVPRVDRAKVAIHYLSEREVDESRVRLADDIRGN